MASAEREPIMMVVSGAKPPEAESLLAFVRPTEVLICLTLFFAESVYNNYLGCMSLSLHSMLAGALLPTKTIVGANFGRRSGFSLLSGICGSVSETDLFAFYDAVGSCQNV